jgi:hypothetical protein
LIYGIERVDRVCLATIRSATGTVVQEKSQIKIVATASVRAEVPRECKVLTPARQQSVPQNYGNGNSLVTVTTSRGAPLHRLMSGKSNAIVIQEFTFKHNPKLLYRLGLISKSARNHGE